MKILIQTLGRRNVEWSIDSQTRIQVRKALGSHSLPKEGYIEED
jgi:hypothetical protein